MGVFLPIHDIPIERYQLASDQLMRQIHLFICYEVIYRTNRVKTVSIIGGTYI